MTDTRSTPWPRASATGSVNRDASWVQREYDSEKWPAVERQVQAVIASEPTPRLDRVLGRMARWQWQQDDPLAEGEHVFAGRPVTLPSVIAHGGQHAMVMELVLAACRDDTDLVVELGAGWGWRVLSVWLNGGPVEALYVGAEYTGAGRRAAERLAGLDEQLSFRAVGFDYHNPSLATLPRGRHAVVLTQHSIEQIPTVKPELFEAIRSLADEVTVVHSEPIGWQIGGGHVGTSADYATHHDYNRNLVETLRKEEAAGRLQLIDLRAELVGVNPRNGTSIAVWRAPLRP